jgi:hypothetical protein
MVGILGVTIGIKKKKRSIVIASSVTCIGIVIFTLFLIFIVIPGM